MGIPGTEATAVGRVEFTKDGLNIVAPQAPAPSEPVKPQSYTDLAAPQTPVAAVAQKTEVTAQPSAAPQTQKTGDVNSLSNDDFLKMFMPK